MTTINRNFRLSLLTDCMLEKTADSLGINKTSVVEMALRKMGRAQGIFAPDSDELEKQYKERKEDQE
jgi:hypothetical protein